MDAMSSRTSCMRPPVMMSPPKVNNRSPGSSPEPQSSSPVGEPEIKSISFQESLRFFQQQFIKSSSSSPSRKLPLKIRLRPVLTKDDQPKFEDTDKTASGGKKEFGVKFTSSEIPPIPTVETILESVRILRAIQRSQAQGGTLWTLECDDESLSCDMSQLDSLLSLDSSLNGNGDSDLQMSFPNSEAFSSLDNNVSDTNTNTSNGSDKNGSSFLIPGLNREEMESKVNNLCAFWPRAVFNMVNQNVDFNHLMLSDDKCNDLNAVRPSKNVPEDMCDNVEVREGMNISLQPTGDVKDAILDNSPSSEASQKSISSFGNTDENSAGCLDSCLCGASVSSGYQSDQSKAVFVDDLGVEYMSCSSLLTFHEDLLANRTDVTDRPPSALDSGIATDKSLDSCSPSSCLSHFADAEAFGGSSWTGSSHYDSAEGSPFVSLSDAAIALSLPDELTCISLNDSKLGSKNIRSGRRGSPVCSSTCDDEQGNGICDSNLDDTDVDFDTCNSSLCETDNAASPELSERDLLVCSPYQCDRSISPKLSEDFQRDRLLEIVEDLPKSSDDVQRDRLLEVVEDSLHQVEFIPTEIKSTVSEKTLVDDSLEEQNALSQNAATTSSMCVDQSVFLEKGVLDHSNVNGSNLNSSDISGADILHTQCSNGVIEAKTMNNIVDVGDQDIVTSKVNRVNSYVQPDEVALENKVCISKVECTLTKPNTSVMDIEDNADIVDERPKKAPTLSWDPVLLLQYIYRLDKPPFYQHTEKHDEKHCGMLQILPLGTFANCGGLYFVVLEKSYFYCYESSEVEDPLFCIPLQYATVKLYDKHSVVIDNRQGRYIHIKFESEDDLNEWSIALESHSKPCQSSQHVEPVHYPLKCHKDVIIVDLGSCCTRAGILMDQPTLPSIFFPTVCATDKKSNEKIFGLEALLPEVRQNSVLSFPVRTSAKVTKFTMDIEALRGLFEKIFHELAVDPSVFTLEISIPRALSIQTQTALVKLLLEDLKVKSVSLTRQALLTLYAHGTSTGIVVDIGDRMDILPVVDGFILETGVSRLPYGGQRIIHHLKHALAQKHISLSNEVESYLVQYIMESLCYVAEDYEKELQYAASFPESVKKSIPLHPFFQADNVLTNVSLDIGRFQVPEGLFNPDLWGLDSPGLHKLVHQAIQSSGVDVRRHIAESIYVSGGVTLLPGFVERLEMEISRLTLPRLKPQVHASTYRNHMAYLGACKLAASDAFPQVCVTADEWMHMGPRCLQKWHL